MMIYELPHPLDRKGQKEAFEYIINSPYRFVFVQAPTGSGKSAWVAEASKTLKTLVLVHTKSLQSANYQDSYGFDILYGKSNYPCLDWHNSKLGYRTDDCDIKGCGCPYYQQFATCVDSERASLNYAKYLRTRRFVELHNPDILFLDECHQLPNIVTDYVGITIRWDNEFVQWQPDSLSGELEPERAISILTDIWSRIAHSEPKKNRDLKRHRQWRYQLQKVETTLDLFSGKDWYFEATDEKITCKPLTAKYHFLPFFDTAPKVILMSATLNANLLASELGIDEYDTYTVPNVYPAPMRRIWDLNVPSMNYRSTEEDRDRQAKIIADSIKSQPTHWSGVVHVTSKRQPCDDMAQRLRYNGIDIFIPPKEAPTEVQLQSWYRNRQPGRICIAWSFHEGVDLGDDQICITAKVPYASIAEGYEQARVDYSPEFYRQQTAWKLEQSVGRVRRGRLEHYIPSQKFVAVADRSWRGLKRLLSEDFKQSIKEL